MEHNGIEVDVGGGRDETKREIVINRPIPNKVNIPYLLSRFLASSVAIPGYVGKSTLKAEVRKNARNSESGAGKKCWSTGVVCKRNLIEVMDPVIGYSHYSVRALALKVTW